MGVRKKVGNGAEFLSEKKYGKTLRRGASRNAPYYYYCALLRRERALNIPTFLLHDFSFHCTMMSCFHYSDDNSRDLLRHNVTTLFCRTSPTYRYVKLFCNECFSSAGRMCARLSSTYHPDKPRNMCRGRHHHRAKDSEDICCI